MGRHTLTRAHITHGTRHNWTILKSHLFHTVFTRTWTSLKERGACRDLYSGVQQDQSQDGNHCTLGWYISYLMCFNLIATMCMISYRTLDREQDWFGKGKLWTRPLRLNHIKIFLDANFIQDQRVGFVAKKQGFPKRCPTLANLWDRVRFSTNIEAF